MSYCSIFATPVVQSRFTEAQFRAAASFLIKHRMDLVLSDVAIKSIANVRLFSSTPICRIYQNLVADGKLQKFLFYDLSNFNGDVPSALTVEDVTIIGSILPGVPVVPELINKTWINITPVCKKDLYHDVTISDTTRFAEMVVRAALCEGYTKSVNKLWLNPNLMAYAVEFYASVISSHLGNMFNLNIEESKFIGTLFAAYMAQQMIGDNALKEEVPQLLYRCTSLGSNQEIEGRLQSVRQYRHNDGRSPLNIELICHIIAEAGPGRMNKFTPSQCYTFLSSSFMDSQIMMIALDYPPYWVYQMLRVASGAKNPVINNYIRLTGNKNKLIAFADAVVSSNLINERLS